MSGSWSLASGVSSFEVVTEVPAFVFPMAAGLTRAKWLSFGLSVLLDCARSSLFASFVNVPQMWVAMAKHLARYSQGLTSPYCKCSLHAPWLQLGRLRLESSCRHWRVDSQWYLIHRGPPYLIFHRHLRPSSYEACYGLSELLIG